ncbi:ATP-binding protein [Aestuariimicrobium sp. Y1814]|uniref:sensor histidine kinase n=1 Tax=Aestuariimicrobium sp. Y1814 TaxID=3418742 RepID=UPI003DA6D921
MTRRASMRARILVAMCTVLVITNALVMYAATRTHAAAIERPIAATLDARAENVVETAAESPDYATLAERLGQNIIQVSITTVDGRQLGVPLPPDLNSVDYRYRIVNIDGGGELHQATATLWVSADLVLAEHYRLQRILAVVGAAALIASVLLMILVTNAALRPLDEMADRARRIGSGERGIRMGETPGPPEVMKTVEAIDTMLDKLEQSEARAMSAEMDAVEAHAQMQTFLADAAHELKTPLAGIQAAAEALMHLPDDAPSSEREDLEYLLAREANRGGHLVTSLLEAAHVDAGLRLRPVELDVMPLLEAERRRVELARPALDVQVSGDDLTVLGDRNGYTSVLRNLIENAATAATVAGTPAWVRVLCREGEGDAGHPMVEVYVMDSGPGIPEQDRERVFDRLVRLPSTASSTKGSGLGLAIARGYARAMGGDVRHAEVPEGVELPGPVGAVFLAWAPLAE